MKKILFIITAAVAVLFWACEDDPKPVQVEEEKEPVYAQGEYEALMTIYDSLHFEKCDTHNGYYYKNWGKKTFTERRWEGVTFEEDAETGELYVTKLFLKELPHDTTVVLPDVFDKFTRLRVLCISGGYSVYDKEDGWRTLSLLKFPESICRCPLDSLSMSFMRGELPANFSELSKTLEYIEISYSDYDNSLLTALKSFPKLKRASLTGSKFTGKVPYFELPNGISLSYNGFTEFNWDYLADKESLEYLPYLHINPNLKGPFIMTVEELLQKDYTAEELDEALEKKLGSENLLLKAWNEFYYEHRSELQ